ncbi:rac GTPase-activating protein 1-like isoform X1 [Styela clava]
MSIETFSKLPLVTQLDQVLRGYRILATSGCEPEFLQFASQFESVRKIGYQAEQLAQDLQEKLTKTEAERNALMIKLKHARRQIEVELKQRQKAEQDRDELDQQIMLVRDLLFSDDTGTTVPLNEEQRGKLDFLNSSRFASPRGGRTMHRRLQRIDETGSILSDYSDISFDLTEDDLDATTLRNGKQYRRAKMGRKAAYNDEDQFSTSKRQRYDVHSPGHNNSYQAAVGGNYYLKTNEQFRCTVDGPTTVSVERLEKSFTRPAPHQGRRRQSREHRRRSAGLSSESEAPQSDVDKFWPTAPEPSAKPKSILRSIQTTPTKSARSHNMQSKPCVIVKETCKPCGKRIQFGKRAMKCAECRLVTHPECEIMAHEFQCDPSQYSPSGGNSNDKPFQGAEGLEAFLHSDESPQIPPIIYHTIHEIDRRGMQEVGLYRVPGMVRAVRELKEKFLKGKTVPDLSKVQDVHTLCSLVKDFLRETLRESILTFNLHPRFISAADKDNDADLFQAISELPQANRDTLAFILLHLQRIVETPEIRMSPEALSKAMGPSLIGFSSDEPSVHELQTSSGYQEKILTRLLNLSSDYYTNIMHSGNRAADSNALRDVNATPEPCRDDPVRRSTRNNKKLGKADSTTSLKAPESSLFGPVGYSPKKTPSSTSLAERAKKYLHGTPFGRGKRKENFFESPVLH